MRVSVVLASLAAGGAERVGITVAAHLVSRGHDVRLVAVRGDGPLLQVALDSLGSERVHRVGSRRLVTGVAGLARHIRSFQPDVLLAGPDDVAAVSHLARTIVATTARPSLVAVVHTTLSARNGRLTGKARLASRVSRRLLRRADRVVAVSQGARADLVGGGVLPSEQVTAIPNPLDLDTMRRRAADDVPPLPPGRPLLVTAARLATQKDHATLLRAFAVVRQEHPDAQLLLLGDGPLRSELEQLRETIGLSASVHFLGHVDNPWAYMRAADVFVLSSMWEGWALAVAEALWCGTRVVATDCPSGPREILDDGRYGWLVPVGHGSALADSIVRALASDVPVGGAEHVEARYCPTRVAGHYEAVLADVVGRHGPADAMATAAVVRSRGTPPARRRRRPEQRVSDRH